MKGQIIMMLAAVMLFSVSSCKKAVVSCISTSSNVVTVGEAVDFTSCSVNGESYVWTFGDGATSTESNPSHTYTRVGVYQVTLNALAKKDKKADEQTLTITVLPSSNTSLFTGSETYRMTYIATYTDQRYDSFNSEPMADTTYNDTMIVDRTFNYTENGGMVYLEIETISGSCGDFALALSGDSFTSPAADNFVCRVSPSSTTSFNGLTGTFTENGNAVSYSYGFVRALSPTSSGTIELDLSASGYRLY